MGSLLRRAHFESLRAAEAKNAAIYIKPVKVPFSLMHNGKYSTRRRLALIMPSIMTSIERGELFGHNTENHGEF